MPATELSRAEAARLALVAQGLAGPRPSGPKSLLDAVGAVQLDTIAVLRRSHLLVAFARLGAVDDDAVEQAYWPTGAPTTFEYWSHAACILPIERWPAFAFRRRKFAATSRRLARLRDPELTLGKVRGVLSEGPATATELGGATGGGAWWDWTQEKIGVEWLLQTGEVVCTRREGWRRVYDLAERAIPERLRSVEPDDEACHVMLLEDAGRYLGVATLGELTRHHRLLLTEARAALPATSLAPVTVEGVREPCYTDPVVLARAESPVRSRTTLLSPFDSFVWDRVRLERLFAYTHRIEAYTPQPQRVHGYYPMPILSGSRLVGRVDPAREGATLVARRVSVAPGDVDAAARAIAEAASWVRATAVRVDIVTPIESATPLRDALSALGA